MMATTAMENDEDYADLYNEAANLYHKSIDIETSDENKAFCYYYAGY